jgi:dimethylsulfone monooxygenase
MYNNNTLKLGLFGANCSSGRFVTNVPERWSGSWDDNLRLARMADRYGLDFLLPVARWRAYGDQGDYQASTLETLTWAAGLLAVTERITVFGTVHAPLFNPILAAKQMVTADQIGHGRFGLNLVVGWNEGEFRMFGVSQREHQTRYDYAQEWIDAIKRIWSPEEIFDFDGGFVKLTGVRAHPKPFENTFPVVMNAGQSDTGRKFATRNCDAFFNVTGTTLAEQADAVQVAKREAKAFGNELDVYTIGVATCRATQKEAEDYYHYAIVENADWVSVEDILAARNITRASMSPQQYEETRRDYAKGLGGWKLVGSPDYVAGELARLASAGLRGVGMSIVNYAEELPFFCEQVLPRLEKMGLREKSPAARP